VAAFAGCLGHRCSCQATFLSLTNYFLNFLARSARFGGKSSRRRQPKQRHRPPHSKPGVQQLAAVLAEEHLLTNARRARCIDHEASQEGRTNPYCGTRHLAGQEAGGTYGAQSCNRPSNPDQGRQKGRFPSGQGFQAGGLRPYRTPLSSTRAGGAVVRRLVESVESYPACQPDVNLSRRPSARRDPQFQERPMMKA
jgi:hypothetical protein